jgi:hypothetical protein
LPLVGRRRVAVAAPAGPGGLVGEAQDDPGAPDAPHPSLVEAKRVLDELAWYPRPVRIEGVRLAVVPLLFALPWFRRFDGYATHRVIFLRERRLALDLPLVTHELCHVWQMQHRPLAMPASYLRGYAGNRYEHEARRAGAEAAIRSAWPGHGR